MNSRKIQHSVSSDFRVEPDKAEIQKRLKQAIKNAGGPTVISAKTGIPLTTLHSYTSGASEPRLSTSAIIAAACNVSLQWLVYGEGPPERKHFRGWEPLDPHPVGQAAIFLYQRIFETGSLITPDAFQELMVEMYRFYADGVPEDDPRWAQLRRVIEITLRGVRATPQGPIN